MTWNADTYATALATHKDLKAAAKAALPLFLRRHWPTYDGKPIPEHDLRVLIESPDWTIYPGEEWIYATHDGLSEWHGPEEYEEMMPVEYLWDPDAGDARLAAERAEEERRAAEAAAERTAREEQQRREQAEADARRAREADLAELARLKALYPDA